MRHVTLHGLKFFSGQACINRRDGAKLAVHQVMTMGRYVYHGNHRSNMEGPTGMYTLFFIKETHPKAVTSWTSVGPLETQAIINAFRKGSNFDEVL